MIEREVVETRPRASRHWSKWARDSFLAGWSRGLLLPFFILMTPFLVFLDHNSYCVACRETFVSLALISTIALLCSLLMMPGGRVWSDLVVAGLLVFFLDIQFNWLDERTKYTLVGLVLGFLALSRVLMENLYVVVTAVFATFFIVTIVQLPLTSGASAVRLVRTTPAANGNAPPRLIQIESLGHVVIKVRDLKVSEQFYIQVLGRG